MKAEITVNATGTNGSLRLDGQEISGGVRGFTLSSSVGHVTQLELDVVLVDVTRLGAEWVDVHIPPAAYDLLVRLGWTPPTVSPSGSGTPPS